MTKRGKLIRKRKTNSHKRKLMVCPPTLWHLLDAVSVTHKIPSTLKLWTSLLSLKSQVRSYTHLTVVWVLPTPNYAQIKTGSKFSIALIVPAFYRFACGVFCRVNPHPTSRVSVVNPNGSMELYRESSRYVSSIHTRIDI